MAKYRFKGANLIPANKFVLAIDGGATKTLAAITDGKGKIVGLGKSGPSNYQAVGEEAAVESLSGAIKEAFQKWRKMSANSVLLETKNTVINRAVFAVAGIDTEMDRKIVKKLAHRALMISGLEALETIVENDGESALLGAAQGEPGVLLISGTGSICFAHDGKGRMVRTGGWGHIIGDEGSGYWIGSETLRIFFKMADGRIPKSGLYKMVLEYFVYTNHEELYNYVYSGECSVDKIASLAKVTEAARMQGDKMAESILDMAARELSDQVISAVKAAGIIQGPFLLVLQGGVLQRNEYVRNRLIAKIKEAAPDFAVMSATKEPIEFIIQRGLFEKNNVEPL